MPITAGQDAHGQAAELAYGIGPAHRKQGLATRAVRLMTDLAYRRLSIDRVLLRIAAENTGSAAVALATGFERTDDAPFLRHDERPLFTWLHQRHAATTRQRDEAEGR